MSAPVRLVTLVLVAAVTILFSASAALADAPGGGAWPTGTERSGLEWILYFGGGTVALIVVISLFGLLTARNNYVPPPPSTDLERAPSSSPAHH